MLFEEAKGMDNPIKKTISRPINQVDEVDCALNWGIFNCPYCDGAGGVRDEHPESETYGEHMDCDQCGGSGQVAVLRR